MFGYRVRSLNRPPRTHSCSCRPRPRSVPTGSPQGRVPPQFLDVFFAYLTDSPAAALALRDAMATNENGTQPVTKFLRGPLTDAQVTALHKARARFFLSLI